MSLFAKNTQALQLLVNLVPNLKLFLLVKLHKITTSASNSFFTSLSNSKSFMKLASCEFIDFWSGARTLPFSHLFWNFFLHSLFWLHKLLVIDLPNVSSDGFGFPCLLLLILGVAFRQNYTTFLVASSHLFSSVFSFSVCFSFFLVLFLSVNLWQALSY